ncbi:methionyl-tRNA formyltransferase, partial [Streptomyces sp. NPDC054796]
SASSSWAEGIAACAAYRSAHGNLEPPRGWTTTEGLPFYSWLEFGDGRRGSEDGGVGNQLSHESQTTENVHDARIQCHHSTFMRQKMPTRLRIAVISSGPTEFSTIHAACTDAGHLPVAYFYGRSLRSGGPNLDDAGEMTASILDAVPPGMDLLLPGDMKGLSLALQGYRPDLLIVFGFAWKLPPHVLAIPPLGALNVHVSMLPKYRGPAPLLWAIRDGDPSSGITVHRMDHDFDTGNILAQQDGIPLPDDITWESYCTDAMPIVHELLRTSLDRAVAGDAGAPQDDSAASYAGFMEPEFSFIDWTNSARTIHHQVRTHRFMRSPERPLARVDDRWLHVQRTSLEPADGLLVTCGDGHPLWITESATAQPPEQREGE